MEVETKTIELRIISHPMIFAPKKDIRFFSVLPFLELKDLGK